MSNIIVTQPDVHEVVEAKEIQIVVVEDPPAATIVTVNMGPPGRDGNGAAPVSSVFGRIGAVIGEFGDYAHLYDALGSAATVQTNLDTHVGDETNPHKVTAAQAGADPAGSADGVQTDLDSHKSNLNNPHAVTATQAGADPAGSSQAVRDELDAHKADLNNPHQTDAADVGADPAGSAAAVQANLTAHEGDQTVHYLQTDISHLNLTNVGTNTHAQIDSHITTANAHIASTANPHATTKAQVGLGNADNTADLDKPISTATQTALDTKEETAQKGVANGYCPLGADGKVPPAFTPPAQVLMGGWDANTNTPDLAAGEPYNDQEYWIVTDAGSTNLGGITTWNVGDWAMYLSSEPLNWVRVPAAAAGVESFNTRQGVVVPIEADYSAFFAPIAHVSDQTNPHVTKVMNLGDVATFTPAAGQSLVYRGTEWTGEAHNDRTDNPHAVTAAQAGADPAGSAAAVQANLDTHTGDGTIHFTVGSILHSQIQEIGSNTHPQIDSHITAANAHIADGTIHFTEASIQHANIQGVGSNTHAQIDTHLADNTVHYPQTAIDHTVILNRGANTHNQIDSHISTANIHFADVANDGIAYARRDQAWAALPEPFLDLGTLSSPVIDFSGALFTTAEYTMVADTTFTLAGMVPGREYRLILRGDYDPTFTGSAVRSLGWYNDPTIVRFLATDSDVEITFDTVVANYASLFGEPANYSPGTGYSAITNWEDGDQTGPFRKQAPDPVTGLITFPEDGLYRINFLIVFQQGNDNKELTILFWARSSREGDFVVSAMEVATDKTNWRSGSGSFQFEAQALDTMQLGLSHQGGSIGTVNFDPCTFEAEFIGFTDGASAI